MMDPERLMFDPGASELDRELIASWSAVRPSPASKARVLAALGVTTIAGTAAATTVGGSVAPKAAAAIGMVWLKWMAAGVVAVGVAGGVAYGVSRSEQEAPPASTTTVTTTTASAGAGHEKAAAPAAAVASSDVPVVSTNDLPRSAPATRAAPLAKPLSSAELAEQVAALDRARGALESGDATSAIGLVDAYEAHYPSGAFLQEAELLRVQSLYKKGDRAPADAAAKRFLDAYPKSPHAGRVRALLGT